VGWNTVTNSPQGCGDPSFFVPVITQIANVLAKQGPPANTPGNPGPSSNVTAGQALNAGVQQIPGLTPAQRSQITAGLASPPPPPPPGNSLSAPGANQLPAMPTAIQPAQSKSHSNWGLLILALGILLALLAALEGLRRFSKARSG
jgi:hypothetical protein